MCISSIIVIRVSERENSLSREGKCVYLALLLSVSRSVHETRQFLI